jgi:sortase A
VPAGRRGGGLLRTLVRGTGQLLITLGVVVLLFCVYELQVTGLYTRDQQKGLEQQFDAPAPTAAGGAPGGTSAPVPLGSAYARIWLPRLGVHFVVVEGVSVEDLKKGPGHYPGTAAPGGLGNTVISGHRTTYLAPFNRLDVLRPGDAVVVETRTTWWTYTVTGSQVVEPTAIEVTYPVPGRKGAAPSAHLLTLTTCNPKYSARQRLVVRGLLAASSPRAAGLPPALRGSA